MKHKIITATITRKHFKSGQKKPHKCPVALALQEAGCKNADVARFGRRWDVRWGKWIVRLPVAARKVAVAFDYNKPISLPITFTIDTKKDWVQYLD